MSYKDNNIKIWITEGNKVSFGSEFITSFKTFNEAWTFAQRFQKLILDTGLDAQIFTQGGTWLIESQDVEIEKC